MIGESRRAAPNEEELPRFRLTRGRLLATLVFVASALAFLYFVLPKLLGLNETWNRIQHGNAWWLALAALLEVCSFGGYVWLFRGVFVRGESRIGWPESYQITMASLAATRLFAAAGAGGIALTAWALRRSGMAARTVGSRMISFLALLYGVYMVTLVVDGVGLYLGVIPGGGSFAITMVPAIFGAIVIVLFLGISLLPDDVGRLVGPWTHGRGRVARLAFRLAAASATASSGVRTAIDLLRARDPSVFGALAWWGFDIGVLITMLHAFGVGLPVPVVVLAYFLGTTLNLVPLPGSLSSGLAGALIALGAPVGGAIAAVLAYRALAVWLPAAPGIASLASLRRSVAGWRKDRVVVAAPADARSPYRSRTLSRRQYGFDIHQLQGATNVAH